MLEKHICHDLSLSWVFLAILADVCVFYFVRMHGKDRWAWSVVALYVAAFLLGAHVSTEAGDAAGKWRLFDFVRVYGGKQVLAVYLFFVPPALTNLLCLNLLYAEYGDWHLRNGDKVCPLTDYYYGYKQIPKMPKASVEDVIASAPAHIKHFIVLKGTGYEVIDRDL